MSYLSPVYEVTLALISWFPERRTPEPKLFVQIFSNEIWILIGLAVVGSAMTLSATDGEGSAERRVHHFLWFLKGLLQQGGGIFDKKYAR